MTWPPPWCSIHDESHPSCIVAGLSRGGEEVTRETHPGLHAAVVDHAPADPPPFALPDLRDRDRDDEDEDEDDLPVTASYVVEYAWGCPECGEVVGTDDYDLAGTVQDCPTCGARVRVTT